MQPSQSIHALSLLLNRIDSSKGPGVSVRPGTSTSSTVPAASSSVPAASSSVPAASSSVPAASASNTSTTSTTSTTTTTVKDTNDKDNNDNQPVPKDAADSQPITTNKESAKQEKAEISTKKALESTVWYEYLDPASGKPYYHNYHTSETSWTAPSSFIPHSVSTAAASSSAATNSSAASDVVFRGYFNAQNGRFTGSSSYWEQQGVPQDRSARQLAAFLDVKELDRNREEAKQIRQQVAKSKNSEQWKTYNEQKKLEKKRKREAWLHED
jgi:hypothetical protein